MSDHINDPHGVTEDLVDAMEAELENIEGETKAEKFVRLASSRHRTLIKRIRLLANLGNRGNYEYDDEQVKLMFDNIRAEVDKCEAQFTGGDSDDIFDPFAPAS